MPTSEQASQILEALASVEQSVDALAAKSDIQESELKRGKRRDKWLAVSVALDILLSVAFLFLGRGVLGNQDRLDHVQATQQATQTTQQADAAINRTALCALFGVFIQLEPNLAKSPNYSPEQKANQVVFFRVMHQTVDTLRCTQ